jgi:hypothetical protein
VCTAGDEHAPSFGGLCATMLRRSTKVRLLLTGRRDVAVADEVPRLLRLQRFHTSCSHRMVSLHGHPS